MYEKRIEELEKKKNKYDNIIKNYHNELLFINKKIERHIKKRNRVIENIYNFKNSKIVSINMGNKIYKEVEHNKSKTKINNEYLEKKARGKALLESLKNGN